MELTTTQNNSGTKSNLQKVQDQCLKQIEGAFKDNQIEFDQEQKNCVLFAVNKIDDVLRGAKIAYKDINNSSLYSVLQAIAMFRLNAINKECFISTRNVKVGDNYIKVLEFGVEGQGNDKILRTYGVDIKSIKYSFVVRENDEFNYPYFDGEKMHLPTWKPKSFVGKVSKVCYIIEKKNGELVPLIAERESVVLSVVAQIKQNLMQKQREWGFNYKDKVNEILARAEAMPLDDLLNDKDLSQYVSPTYTNPASREAMIERKLRNLCCKQYPKDFKNAFIGEEYDKVVSDRVGDAEIVESVIDTTKNDETEVKKGFETKNTLDLTDFNAVESDKEEKGINIQVVQQNSNKEVYDNYGLETKVDNDGVIENEEEFEDELPF